MTDVHAPRDRSTRPRPVRAVVAASALIAALAVGSAAIAAPANPDEGEPRSLRLVTATVDRDSRVAWTADAATAGAAALVQFDEGLAPAARRAIVERAGGRYGRYVPDDGATVWLTRQAYDRLSADPRVALLSGIEPGWKVEPQFADGGYPAEAWVTLQPWATSEDAAPAFAAAGVAVLDRPTGDRLEGTYRVRLEGPRALDALAAASDVAWIERAFQSYLMNDRSRWIVQSNVDGATTIHDQGVLGATQLLAVMDSGLDERHCCFDRKRIDSYTPLGGGDDGDYCSQGHGTHVAGTAACAEPGAVFDGVAPQADIAVQDVQNSGWQSCFLGAVQPPSDLRDAYTAAYGRGARVHTNSWGGGGSTYGTPARQSDDFVWNNPDFVILYAAGNGGGGTNASTISSQAAAKNILTVGGTESAPRQEFLYGSSSKGPTGDGRFKPDITAPATGPAGGPGPSVTSAASGSSCDFSSKSGTSMATPAAAGSAILVRDYFEQGYWPTGAANAADAFNPTAALVKAMLIASADDMQGDDTSGRRPNNSQGWGRVNLDNALTFASDAETLLILDDRDASTGFSAAGEEVTFDFYLEDAARPFRTVLVWSDPPAASGSTEILVNDLDLEVFLRGEVRYVGNGAFENGQSLPNAGTPDRLNNVETVLLDAPQAGNVSIRVRADSIGDLPGGRLQDYALVVVGGVSSDVCTAAAPNPVDASGLTVERTANGARLSWPDSASDHYHVYRQTVAADYADPQPAFDDPVTDVDAAAPGVQWDDTAPLAPGQVAFYRVAAANGCHDE